MLGDRVAGPIDQATLRECIEAQRCPWCGREGLRSLANHTVLVHEVYAHELRELAGLPPDAPLCSGVERLPPPVGPRAGCDSMVAPAGGRDGVGGN
jgi:hypothetical protein